MDEAADLIEARGYASYLPELLRLKGSVLLLMSKVNAADAETCFKQSFEVSSCKVHAPGSCGRRPISRHFRPPRAVRKKCVRC